MEPGSNSTGEFLTQKTKQMKWPSQVNNDAEILHRKGIKSQNTDDSYAKAWHAGMKIWKYFATSERFEKFRKNSPDFMEWKVIIINEKH
jgi:beta-lactamase class A